jgi:hypothetical protein
MKLFKRIKWFFTSKKKKEAIMMHRASLHAPFINATRNILSDMDDDIPMLSNFFATHFAPYTINNIRFYEKGEEEIK